MHAAYQQQNKQSIDGETMTREPSAYIVTNNRGKRYLAFAGSVEHQNAKLFNYSMRPLHE